MQWRNHKVVNKFKGRTQNRGWNYGGWEDLKIVIRIAKAKNVLKFASGWILSYILINLLNSPYIETMIHPSTTDANNIFN